VHEAASHSGSARAPMRLRASYAPAVKRGTLVHELGHRYLAALALPRSELSEHQKLDLLLVPVWTQLWGDAFVARQIAVESAWSNEYRRSWQWWSALQPDERGTRWRALLASSRARDAAPRSDD
jgi:hypothetical protein